MLATIRISGKHHAELRRHLLPPDGNEAVALALCGRHQGPSGDILCIHELHPIAYAACKERTPIRVTWPMSLAIPLLQKAMQRHFGIVKIHSHRQDARFYSELDDESDRDFFSAAHTWLETALPHATAIMLPTGEILARSLAADGCFCKVPQIAVAGDDLHFWRSNETDWTVPEFARRHAQAFGGGTTEQLRNLTIAVVGCSGTGSPTIELLARLGVGTLILVDPDKVEEKNLNRILNATMEDAVAELPKVSVAERAINRMALGTKVVPVCKTLLDPAAVRLVAGSDVVLGCMDGAEGRNVLNRLATFYCIPYFDVGVRLDADGEGGISQICGGVHYLQPGGSSLLSRNVITQEELDAEGLKRTDPEIYAERFRQGYIKGVRVDRPAVASVNMYFASMAVNEFLARLHPFRDDDNADYAWLSSSLTQVHYYHKPDGSPCKRLAHKVGRGEVVPLLDMPVLSE